MSNNITATREAVSEMLAGDGSVTAQVLSQYLTTCLRLHPRDFDPMDALNDLTNGTNTLDTPGGK